MKNIPIESLCITSNMSRGINSSGYAGGTAQIPWTNDVNNKSRPNSTMNFRNSSGLAQGAFRSFLAGKSNSSNLMADDAIDVTPLPRGLEIAIFKAV